MDTSWIGTCSYGHLLFDDGENNESEFPKRGGEMKRKRESDCELIDNKTAMQ